MTTNDNAVKCSQVSGPYLFVKISYSKLTFSYSKLTFLTRNSLSLLETHFSYSKLTFLTRNSLFLLETHFPGNALQEIKFGRFYIKEGIQNVASRRKYALLVPFVEIDGQFLLKGISTSVCWFGTAVSARFFLYSPCFISIICGCTLWNGDQSVF